MTDEKKKPEKKAEDTIEEPKEQTIKQPQPESIKKPEGSVSKLEKTEKVVETSKTEDKKSDSDIEEKPILSKPTMETKSGQPDEKTDSKTEEKPILEKSTEENVSEEPEKKPIEEQKKEHTKPVETKQDSADKVKAEQTEQKQKTKDTQPQKEPKKTTKKKEEQDEDFQYIVRIANTDIDGNKNVVMGIAQIKGIGRHMAVLIADATGIDKKLKMGKLDDAQIEKIRSILDDIEKIAPGWMLNHRKDIETGKNIHLISSDVDLRLRDDINLLKMIRSYRGIRHETGLSVRGQRTRANNRRGLALGVSKKRP